MVLPPVDTAGAATAGAVEGLATAAAADGLGTAAGEGPGAAGAAEAAAAGLAVVGAAAAGTAVGAAGGAGGAGGVLQAASSPLAAPLANSQPPNVSSRRRLTSVPCPAPVRASISCPS